MTDSMSDLSNTVIRGYELKDLLGQGGFGAVYRAYQPAVKRDVALKVILPQYANHPDFIRGFEAEAQIIARLEHLHIVSLYDYWREPDSAYLVMRLLRGGSLRGLIEKGPISFSLTTRILDQVCSALNTAHRNKIVHRDIKPDNILLDEDENAYVTDFGIAKDLGDSDEDEDEDVDLTGSPAYLSPEQAMSQPVSPQSDIYSLGIVAYEMLTGSTPYSSATTLMEVIFKQINEPLPSLLEIRPDVPEEVDLVVQRATDKNPQARYIDALSFAADFRRAISKRRGKDEDTAEMGVEWKRETAEFPAVDPTSTVKIAKVVVVDSGTDNPYKGLRPFEEADADDFYGREALIDDLLNRLRDKNFLAVIGPSGSGKSSVVKAGVLPALRRDKLPGSAKWFIAEMVPSANPFQELESALLSVAARRVSNLGQQLRQNERGLLESIQQILPDSASQLVLVIDQFEEVFTLVENESTRAMFLNNLLVATTTSDSPLRVIITMRADFYDRPLLYPGFGELIRKHSEVVLPLLPEEMTRAILKPAENAGLTVEPTLVSAIVTEVSEQPGALPLLQYALTEVYERREGKTLTYAAYQASGGVLGALARRAEELYVQLDSKHQEIARQIFLRLVTLGEGIEDTRRRAEQAELYSVGDDQKMVEDVLAVYSKYRLFTFDNDPVTRNPTVEVAHEALIREWKRLRGWLNDSRDDVRLQQRLASAAHEWQNQRRDPSFLATGARLQQFETLLNSGAISLSDLETDYTRASVAERDRKAREEVARQEHERTLERRALRRLQAGVAIFLVLTLIASILAFFAASARNDAQANERTAKNNEATAVVESRLRATAESQAVTERNQAQIDESRVLAILSLQELTQDPARSIDLALQALPNADTPRPFVAEAELALTEAIKASLERAYLNPFQDSSITALALSDEQIAIAGQGLALVGYDFQNPDFLVAHQNPILGVQWSADGRLLSYDPALVTVWQAGELASSFENDNENPIVCATWQPTAEKIAICAESSLRLWQPTDNEITEIHHLETPFANARWSPDGRYLAAWDSASTQVILWDDESETITPIGPLQEGQLTTDVVWSPDSAALVMVLSDFTARYWSVSDEGDPITLAGHTAAVDGAIFVDTSRIITWGDDGTVRVWSTDGEELFTLSGATPSEVNGVALSPDSTKLLIWQNDSAAHVWDVASGERIVSLQDQTSNILLAAWRDNDFVATTDVDFQIRVWNVTTGTIATTLYGHQNRVKGLDWLDERHLMSYSQDGTIRQWEVFAENGLPLGQGLLYALDGHRGPIEYARWLDDNTVITNGRDGIARRWTLDSGEVVMLPNEDGERWRIVWSPDGSQVLRYLDDAAGEVWELATPTRLYDIRGPIGSEAAFWLESGIFIGQPDGDVLWLDAMTGQTLALLEGHTARINDAEYFSANRLLATAGSDNQIHVWELPATPNNATLSPRSTLTSEGRQPLRLQWSRDGVRLLSGGFNGDVTLWDTQDEEELLFLTGQRDFPVRNTVQFSPDESYIAAPIDNEIFVWNLDGQLIFRTSEDNGILGIEWIEANGRLRLLSWSVNGFVRIWDVESGTEVWHIRDNNRVEVAAFNSDGTQVLSAGGSGRLLIWQAWPDLQQLIIAATFCCQTR